MERARRGIHRQRHRPLRRFLGGTGPGAPRRRRPSPARRHRQRAPDPVAGHRQGGRPGRGSPVPGLATAQRAAPHHHRRRAAVYRAHRHRDRDVPRRVHLPRGPPRRPVLRHPAGERRRGRVAARPPVRGHRIHARDVWICPISGRSRPVSPPIRVRRASWTYAGCVPFCVDGSSYALPIRARRRDLGRADARVRCARRIPGPSCSATAVRRPRRARHRIRRVHRCRR